ncbi:hypothetical protein M758_9G077300 [Ceratodon purpureus]|nr:hypothetical protein M758_9G077300 [Ceratodon purpureus]
MFRLKLQAEIILCGIISFAGFQYFLAYEPFMALILSILISVLVCAFGTKQQLKLPPGPRGVPILGYLPFLSRDLPHQKMAKLAQQYGPLVYIQMGSIPALVVSSPQMLKEVLVTQDHIFGSRTQISTAIRYFGQGYTGLGTAPLGSIYKDMRRLYSQKLISPQMMESFAPMRSDEMKAMVRGLWEDSQGGDNVDLHSAIVDMAANVSTRMVLNKRYCGKNVENLEAARIFQEITDTVPRTFGEYYLADFIPILHPVTSLFNNEKKIADVAKRADAFVETLVEDHLGQLNHVSTKSEQPNLIDVMLSLMKDGQYKLDKQNLKVIILELLLLGTEAIWVSIEWTMAELLRHPDIMRKLQTELDSTVGTSRLVQESDVPNLPYLQAVVRENFRLHPSGPLLIPHESTQATKIAGYDIPARTRVFPNVWAMGRDPSVWDQPTEFDPSRFLNLTESEMQDPKVKFTPFGSGRRGCPGQRPGYLTVASAVAHLVHCFDWAPCDLDVVSETFGGAGMAMLKAPLSCIGIQAPRLPTSLFT